jgi:ribosomal protein S18 acetylase RimI-like enzyme
MYRYAVLDAKTGTAFAPLTYERYRRSLTDAKPEFIAIGAYQLWQPAGLLVGFYDAAKHEAQVLSLTVASEHQKRGVATELLRQFEERLAQRGCIAIRAAYVGDNPALERVFARQGWDAPRITGVAVECNVDMIQPSPIYQMKPVLPPEFEFFEWSDLTADDRAAIQEREAQPGGWYSATELPGSVTPFVEEQFLDGHCSVGLRHKGEVIGWMIVHRIREDALHFISLFVSPEYRRQNLGILLVMSAVQRVVDYYKVHYPTIRVFWQFAIENKVMEQLVEEHLAPYAIAFNREKTFLKKMG